jgi:hypothetical protein
MDTENFNTYASLVFVELSFTSSKFANSITEQFEDLAEIFQQLIKTPSEESQQHLQKVFHHNEEKLKSFLHEYLIKNSSEFNWTTFLNKYEVYPVAGKFFKIDKTEEAYREFVANMSKQRWVFTHMSVTTEENKYTIFFA